MALDLMHADAVDDGTPAGMVTSGGSGSILHAVLAYREHAAQHRGIDRPNFVKPETGAPGVRQGLPPARRRAAHACRSTRRPRSSTPTRWPRAIDDRHDRDRRLGVQLRLRHDRPDRRARPARAGRAASACTSTAASAGSSCRSARSSATTSRRSTSASPASPASRPTPTSTATRSRARSTLLFRDKALPQRAVLLPDRLDRRQVLSPGHRGLPLRRAARRHLGGDGAATAARATWRYAEQIFETADRDEGRGALATPSCGSWAPRRSASASPPTSSTSTTSTTSCGSAAGASTASSTRTRSTWR